jgi:hypothetical protein
MNLAGSPGVMREGLEAGRRQAGAGEVEDEQGGEDEQRGMVGHAWER